MVYGIALIIRSMRRRPRHPREAPNDCNFESEIGW
jgi:hypothetical protein